ncbi:hypothetical protein [Bradyrhizobium sp. STM 3562]|uniref:hypothetical protein n=1 Tax=Bradyrhizobium sp. STM 3562 TaxID=578924 RepID=UPI00388CF3CD
MAHKIVESDGRRVNAEHQEALKDRKIRQPHELQPADHEGEEAVLPADIRFLLLRLV